MKNHEPIRFSGIRIYEKGSSGLRHKHDAAPWEALFFFNNLSPVTFLNKDRQKFHILNQM